MENKMLHTVKEEIALLSSPPFRHVGRATIFMLDVFLRRSWLLRSLGYFLHRRCITSLEKKWNGWGKLTWGVCKTALLLVSGLYAPQPICTYISKCVHNLWRYEFCTHCTAQIIRDNLDNRSILNIELNQLESFIFWENITAVYAAVICTGFLAAWRCVCFVR